MPVGLWWESERRGGPGRAADSQQRMRADHEGPMVDKLSIGQPRASQGLR